MFKISLKDFWYKFKNIHNPSYCKSKHLQYLIVLTHFLIIFVILKSKDCLFKWIGFLYVILDCIWHTTPDSYKIILFKCLHDFFVIFFSIITFYKSIITFIKTNYNHPIIIILLFGYIIFEYYKCSWHNDKKIIYKCYCKIEPILHMYIWLSIIYLLNTFKEFT